MAGTKWEIFSLPKPFVAPKATPERDPRRQLIAYRWNQRGLQ